MVNAILRKTTKISFITINLNLYNLNFKKSKIQIELELFYFLNSLWAKKLRLFNNCLNCGLFNFKGKTYDRGVCNNSIRYSLVENEFGFSNTIVYKILNKLNS